MHHNGATATVANAAGTAGNVNGVGLRRANGPVAAAAANGISSPAPSKLFELSKTVNRFYYGGFKTKECKPLFCDGAQVGLVSAAVEAAIRGFGDVFDISADAIVIRPELDTFDKRTEALDRILRKMRATTDFVALKGWRDETYDIKARFSDPPLFKMERAATCMFGMLQYGVDINGYVDHPEKGLCLWFQRRSKSKPTWPGKIDNFVAGGLSSGVGIYQTALKEAEEEANVPKELAETMKAVGCVTFFYDSERGLFPHTEFVFDLKLSHEFVPSNNDGEVEGFELVPVDKVIPLICSPDMKTTSCPITIDFLIRKGIINAENEPNFPELVENLHIPVHSLY